MGWDTASACSEHYLVATCMLIVFVVASFQCVSLLQLCVPGFALLQTIFYSPSLPPYSMMASLQWPWSGQGCSILGLLRHATVFFQVTCETSSAEGGRGMLQAGSLRGPCLQCASIRIHCKKGVLLATMSCYVQTTPKKKHGSMKTSAASNQRWSPLW